MKQKILIGFIVVVALGFKTPRQQNGQLPNSVKPGGRSTATNLPFNCDNGFFILPNVGLEDSKIFAVKNPSADDTRNSKFIAEMLGNSPPKYGNGSIYYPNYVWVKSNFLIDEVEITNLNWQEFLFYIDRDSSTACLKNLIPDETALPVSDYFKSSFYNFYPVVGISHQQVIEYCKWRTNIINQSLQSDTFKVTVRLPTEKEWEELVSCGNDVDKFPFGVKELKDKIRLLKKSGNYFKEKNKLTEDGDEISLDIENFNKESPLIYRFNCKQDLPYFLKNTTPNYVYNLPTNVLGLYNIIGNVAEMVEEPGIAKGGSYCHEIEDCKISKSIMFSKPEKFVGFRTVCVVESKRNAP